MQPNKAKDADYWAKLHVRSDRSKPVELPDRRPAVGNVFFMWKRPKAAEL